MRFTKRLFLFAWVLLGGLPWAHALPQVNLSGSTSFAVYGTQVGLYVNEIANNSGTTTGTLRLELWATTKPYKGGTISGYSLGTYVLNPLKANQYYPSVAAITAYAAPPDGYYYVTLALEEYNGAIYPIVDYVTYANLQTFGSPSFPPPTPPAPLFGPAKFVGAATAKFTGTKVLISYKRIQAAGNWNTYGMRVRVMAGKQKPATGDTAVFDSGTAFLTLASFNLTTLPPGSYYPKNSVTRTVKKIPKGKYYIYVVLSQDYPSGWATDQAVLQSGRKSF